MEMAKRARAAADRWKAEGILCLASPNMNIALVMEAAALGEPRVCEGAKPRQISKWLEKLLIL